MATPNDKALLFLSAPKTRHIEPFTRHGVNALLISYVYVRKKKGAWAAVLEYLRECGGYLMIDSGAFTFKNDKKNYYHWTKPESYKEYLDEFLQFCYDFSSDIFCTVNMDMDNFVGADVVDRWNEDLFKPLSKVTNVIYNIAHDVDSTGRFSRLVQLQRAEQYCKYFDYVGINAGMAKDIPRLHTFNPRVKIHGFALTKLKVLQSTPIFSVDSASWISGDKFGVTYDYDGRNFRTYDNTQKFRRKLMKLKAKEHGVNHQLMVADDGATMDDYNLIAWKGFEKEYIRVANTKLKTLPIRYYDKRGKK